MAVGQNPWCHFGVGAPPFLEPISVGIAMFTGGTIWILTHGKIHVMPRFLHRIPWQLLLPSRRFVPRRFPATSTRRRIAYSTPASRPST